MAEQEGVYQRVINAIGAITLSPDEGKCIIEFVEGAIHGSLPLKRIPKEISDLTAETSVESVTRWNIGATNIKNQ